jgi:hypothetical protein
VAEMLGSAFLGFPAIAASQPREGGVACAGRAHAIKTVAQHFHMAAPEGDSGMDKLICVTCQQPAKLQCPRW